MSRHASHDQPTGTELLRVLTAEVRVLVDRCRHAASAVNDERSREALMRMGDDLFIVAEQGSADMNASEPSSEIAPVVST